MSASEPKEQQTASLEPQTLQHDVPTADSQSQSTTMESKATTSDYLAWQQSRKKQITTTEQPAPSQPSTGGREVSVWDIGGTFNVDVGNGESVPVPNTDSRAPTREEIYRALVAAGQCEGRAGELADRAYANVMGIDSEDAGG